MAYVNALIDEATEKGVLEPDADSEFTREIARVGSLCAIFESTKMPFKHLASLTVVRTPQTKTEIQT